MLIYNVHFKQYWKTISMSILFRSKWCYTSLELLIINIGINNLLKLFYNDLLIGVRRQT